MKTTLVTVVSGDLYEKFTSDLFDSAEEFFHPSDEVDLLMLYGHPGWPDATMLRPQVLTKCFPDSDFVFLCDADMLFAGPVGNEILRYGLTATTHPGYVGMHRDMLPYERREDSACYIPYGKGEFYFCGGFWGGESGAVLRACLVIAQLIKEDVQDGITPVWHDESALNHYLALIKEPKVKLTPSFCYPDNDTYYKTFWPEKYERTLVALDKSPEQRAGRG